jgi:cytoskeleton protein RodZ
MDNHRRPLATFFASSSARASPPPAGDASAAQSLGEAFRRRREEKCLSREEVAKALSIPVKSVRALEESAFSTLPADVYARGFVKLYAEYLGLDAARSLREFSLERRQARGSTLRAPFPTPLRTFRRQRFRVAPRSAPLAAGALIAVAALAYLFFEVRSFTRAPTLFVADPPEGSEAHSNTIVVRGTTDPAAEVRLNGEQTFVKSDGGFEETIGVSAGVNVLRIVATSIGGRTQVVTREVLVRLPEGSPALPGGTSPALSSASPQADDPFRLTVRAEEEPVWLSLEADGRRVFSGILLPGSAQEATGKEIRVTSGKGQRTKLSYDGQDVGFLSTREGAVHDAVFTRVGPSGTVERR